MSHRRLDRVAFVALLGTMAEGWNTGDVEKTAACFTEDVRYGDPTRYRHESRDALRPFFEAPPEGQSCVWHRIVFDEAEQIGAAEYTYVGSHQYHGLVLVTLRDGLVSAWREYQHVSQLPWERFVEGPQV
jgi:hypothetical protein